jgi:hypothetical protein
MMDNEIYCEIKNIVQLQCRAIIRADLSDCRKEIYRLDRDTRDTLRLALRVRLHGLDLPNS